MSTLINTYICCIFKEHVCAERALAYGSEHVAYKYISLLPLILWRHYYSACGFYSGEDEKTADIFIANLPYIYVNRWPQSSNKPR
jgi:hypothetical protein